MFRIYDEEYAKVEAPLESFSCTASGGATIHVYATSSDSNAKIIIDTDGNTATFSIPDLEKFISTVNRVITGITKHSK